MGTKKKPNLSPQAQQRFAQNIINKRSKSTTNTPTPQQSQPVNSNNKVRPGVDPNGILDGVTKISGEEHSYSAPELLVAFEKGKTGEFEGIVYIGDYNDKKSQEWIYKYKKNIDGYFKKYYVTDASILDWTRFGREKELVIYMS